MRRIADFAGKELMWSQPSALRMEYELRAADDLAAVLRFPSSFSSYAKAEGADGCWTFERVGFWRNKTVVRPCGSLDAIAVYRNSRWGSGGTLELADGRKYPTSANFWHTGLEIKNDKGEPVLRVTSGGVVRLSATVEAHPEVAAPNGLPWLIMLCCYLLVMMKKDAATAAM